MSVEIQLAYYISVERVIGKPQIVLVFLEHQFGSMDLRTTENKVKYLTNKLLGTHEFPQ